MSREKLIKVRVFIDDSIRIVPSHKFRVKHMEHLGDYVEEVKVEKKKRKPGRPKKIK